MKKNLLLVTCFSLIFFAGCNKTENSANLIKNPSFEEGSGSSPASWNQDIWSEASNAASCRLESGTAYDGSRYATITNRAPADAKFIQDVAVKPKSIYRLSGYIKAENIPTGNTGANISVLNILEHFQSFYNTDGKWEYVEVYGRTGPDQNYVEVAVRLGGYSSINTGSAAFDKIELVKVDSLPIGKGAINFYDASPPPPKSEAGKEWRKTIPFSSIVIFSIIYVLFFALIYRFFIAGKELQKISSRTLFIGFTVLLVIAFLSRVIMAPIIEGYQNDLSCFKGWTYQAANAPITQFYNDGGFFDYPPGSIYLFALIGHIRNLFQINIDSSAGIILLKLPSILADLIAAWLIFWFARKKVKETTALGLSILYLFNPCIFVNSAVWGQIDSIAALLVFLVLIFIVEDKLIIASAIFAGAVMIKWQSGFLVLALLFALIRKKDLKTWLFSILSGLGTLVVILLPFNLGKSPFWIFERFINASTGYSYATINAFNIYSLFNGNWARLDANFLGITFNTWGIIFAVLILGYTIFLYIKAKDVSRYYVVTLLFMAMVFILYIMMHERYLYPVLFLCLMSMAYTNDKRFLFIFIGFSITNFFNVAYILDTLMRDTFIKRNDPVMLIGAWGNLLLLLYLIKVTINKYIAEKFLAPKIFGK